MEDRDNPGLMLGEMSAYQEVQYASYKDDPYFRLVADLKVPAERYIFVHSYDGVTAPELAVGLGCPVDVANGLLVGLLDRGVIYYCGDEFLKDGVAMYRHSDWVDDSESYCVVCGSPSHSDCARQYNK
jgi:hypothetical protein